MVKRRRNKLGTVAALRRESERLDAEDPERLISVLRANEGPDTVTYLANAKCYELER